MLIYVFDGSFEGLLTAIHEAYYRREVPGALLPADGLQASLIDTYIHITADSEKSDKVYNSIQNKISQEALEHVYRIYISEAGNYGTLIYRFLQLGWKMGSKICDHLADDTVLQVIKLSKKVGFEIHRFEGLLRFRQLDTNLYYAPMEPDYNILAVISNHFAGRLSDQNWIIHDIKRGLASVYDTHEWLITDMKGNERSSAFEKERDYTMLWKGYFKHIAISSRTNPRLQRQHMPARYWKYLVEKEL